MRKHLLAVLCCLCLLPLISCYEEGDKVAATPVAPAPIPIPQPVVCGDGTEEATEQCEPPGTETCNLQCQDIVCGDGRHDKPVEGCDDGNRDSGDGCSSECKREQVKANLGCTIIAPLVAGCTVGGSPFGNWNSWEWGDGNSSGLVNQKTATHPFVGAGTKQISVVSCQFPSEDVYCGTDDTVVVFE